jgi:signal transduction histidine kinase/CheY-like chemotaxis protein
MSASPFSILAYVCRTALFLFTGVLPLCLSAKASSFQTQHFTTSSGLPHQHVYQIFQDSRDMIWAVTGNSLCYLNGNTFTSVIRWPVDHTTINAQIRFEDSQGNLWIRQYNNNLEASFRIFNIRLMSEIPLHTVIDPDLIPDIYDVGNCDNGQYVFVNSKGKVSLLQPDGKIKTLWQSPNGPVILGTPEQNKRNICLISHNPRAIPTWLTLIDLDGNITFKRKNFKLYDVKRLPGDTILFSDFKHYLKITPKGTEIAYPISDYLPAYANEYHNNWFLPALHPQTQQLYYYHNDKIASAVSGATSIPINTPAAQKLQVYHILISRDLITWVATAQGLYKIKPLPDRFLKFLWNNPTEVVNQTTLTCRGITEDQQGNMYFNARNSVFTLSANKKRLTLFQTVGLESDLFACAVHQDKFWILNSGMNAIDLNTGKKTIYPLPDKSIQGQNWSICPTDHSLWFAINHQLIWLDKKTDQLHRFEKFNQYPELKAADIYHFQAHHAVSGQWWLSTNIGLYLLDESKGIIRSYGERPQMDLFLPATQFRHIHLDKTGTYWLATNNGLIRWDSDKNHLKRYDTSNGFPSNNLYAVLEDDYGFLWISTDNGLVQFQKATGSLRYFTEDDGITHHEFNRISFHKATNGLLYFGGMNGITCFNPANFHEDFHQMIRSPLFLTKAQLVHADPSQISDILPTVNNHSPIKIRHNDRYLLLSLSAPEYLHQVQPIFEYRLDKQSAWSSLSGSDLYLAGLPRGNYTLNIRNRFGNGTYNDEILQIQLSVLPPFYLSGWFLLALSAFISLSFLLFVQYRERNLRIAQRHLSLEVERQTAKINQDNIVLEQQAQRLRQLVEEKTRFLTNVAHELRTPLALISGASHKLLEQKQADKEARLLNAMTERNARQLLKMVNDMLFFASHDQTSIQFNHQICLLHQSLQPIIDDYTLLAKQKNIKVFFSAGTDTANPVSTDPYYLNIIIGNILANAIKFTESGGSVHISTDYTDQTAILQIRDTGRGIHPNDLPYIFERFYQTQQPNNPIEGGAGIGLSLAKDIARHLHIDIQVDSQPGRGSTFSIYIPLATTDSATQSDNTQSPSSQSASTTLAQPHNTILLVEDNPDFRYLLHVYLSPQYELISTENAKAALHHLGHKAPPALIITDIMMPGMDGIQLIKQIKSTAALSGIPIIVISARNDETIQQQIIRFGIDDYLLKPFSESEILSTVAALLSRKAAHSYKPPITTNIAATDQQWLLKLEKVTFESLSSPLMSVDMLAEHLNMSRRTFFREVKRLTGLTPNAYIQEARLQKARYLLEAGWHESMEALVNQVGMKDVKYFAALYRDRFGKNIHSYR